MANPFFNAENQDQELPPWLPTMDTAYGTPDGQPVAGVPGGSPYFDIGGTLGQPAIRNGTPEMTGRFDANPWNATPTPTAAPTTMTGGGFDWSQFQPVDSSSFSQAQSVSGSPTSSGYNAPGFVAPTGVDMLNAPGYQFRLDQARKGIEASALGRGTLLTGGTAKAISSAVGNQASDEYQRVFNNALAGYSENANVGLANAGLQNQAAGIANQNSQFNASLGETHAQNQYGNYYNLANLGLNAAQLANQSAGNYGSDLTNLATGYGGNLAGLYGSAGNVNASAAAGQGNIWSTVPGAIAGVGNAYLAGRRPSGVRVGDKTGLVLNESERPR